MKTAFMACALTMVGAGAASAQPASSPPVYIVAYVDVLASAAPRAAASLRQYRGAARGEPGALRIDLYSQRGRPSGFALVEHWRDGAAYESHRNAPTIEHLRRDLQPLQLAPLDVRVQSAYSLGPPMRDGGNAMTLLVHVDVIPTFLADYERIAKSYIETTRGEPGLLGLDVLQTLPPHTNHLTVVERWVDAAALEAHQRDPATRSYREALNPMLGALYDERIYRTMD